MLNLNPDHDFEHADAVELEKILDFLVKRHRWHDIITALVTHCQYQTIGVDHQTWFEAAIILEKARKKLAELPPPVGID